MVMRSARASGRIVAQSSSTLVNKVITAVAIAIVLASLPAMALATDRAVQGRVQSLDRAHNTITLVGGETFAVPPAVSTVGVSPDEYGTILYQEQRQNGLLVATAIFVDGGAGH